MSKLIHWSYLMPFSISRIQSKISDANRLIINKKITKEQQEQIP